MRKYLLLLCLTLLFDAYAILLGQTPKSDRINLTFKNEPLSNAFKKLKWLPDTKFYFLTMT